MKFHDFKTAKLYALEELYETKRHKEAAVVKKLSPHDYLRAKMPKLFDTYGAAIKKAMTAFSTKTPDDLDLDTAALAGAGIRHLLTTAAELAWFENNRPFYNVYPIVEKLVHNTKLDFPAAQLKFVEDVICFRFPKGHEPFGIKTALIQLNFNTEKLEPLTTLMPASAKHIYLASGHYDTVYENERFVVQVPTPREEFKNSSTVTRMIEDALFAIKQANIAGSAVTGVASQIEEDMPLYTKQLYFLIRLAVLVSLVADGNDLITPAVLASEQEKYDIETDEAAKRWLEERAARIQGRGFDLGKNLQAKSDTSPHWRNPHMALYWTGPGGAEPKLKLRAGSVVIPKHLSQVPTGYDCPVVDKAAAEENKEYVYLLHEPSQGYTKIGKTTRSIEERQKESSTFVPGGLKLRGYIVTADCTALETRLHREWAHKRRENEFFELTDTDVQQIITQFGGVQIEV